MLLMDLVCLLMDRIGKRFLPRGSLAFFDFQLWLDKDYDNVYDNDYDNDFDNDFDNDNTPSIIKFRI